MRSLLVFLMFLASLFITSMSSFADRVFVMAALELLLLYLFNYRRWTILCFFFILCLISNWIICAYADPISEYLSSYLTGILDKQFIYIGCVILIRLCNVLLAGLMLWFMTGYTVSIWGILIFINLISFGMGILLSRWDFFEFIQEKLGYHLGRIK